MCDPVSNGEKKNYILVMRAQPVCDLGHTHDEKFDYAATEKFADAFKAVRGFWEKNPRSKIKITLEIDAAATDHLKVTV